MKKDTGNRVRLGIFVTVAIALFTVVIYFIGNRQHMFGRTIHIKATFKDLGGLQIGNNVRFTGINVGTVHDVQIITDTTVQVEMIIEKDVQKFLKKDGTAGIGTEGLMGNKVINLSAGSPGSPTLEDGASIIGITPINMDDVMKNLATTSRNASAITEDIAALTSNIRSGEGAVGKIFMDSSFAESLGKTMKNAQNATKGLSENMEAAKHNFLLKGYFKKKEKEAEKKKEAEDKNQK